MTVIDRLTGGFSQVDPDSAQLTPAGTAIGTEFADLDVDDSGKGYAITFTLLSGSPLVSSTIQAIDLGAGTASAALPIVHSDGSPAACSTIDYTGGTVLADCVIDRVGVSASLFGTIDPATGILTSVWEYAPLNTDLGSGLATHPITGDLYLFSESNIIRVDLAAQTFQTVVTTMPTRVLQGDFDRDGVYWATLDVSSPAFGLDTVLATVDLTTGRQDVRGSLDTDGDPTTASAWGLTVWGAAPPAALQPAVPTLPATGSSLDAAAGVGAALLTIGIALATHRRRRSAPRIRTWT